MPPWFNQDSWGSEGWHRAAAAAGPYTAQGVNFDGSSTFLSRGAALSNVVDGKQGICSFWFKIKANDSISQIILEDSTLGINGFQILRQTVNTIRFSAANITTLAATTVNTFTVGMGWAHIACAWDLTIPQVQIYTNGSIDLASSPTTVNTNITWTTPTDWFIGARSGGSFLFGADVADFYLNTAQTLDLSNPTKLQMFRSAGGAPVNLGSTGATPTGSVPTIFLSGAVGSWNTNKATPGGGGGFTVNGTGLTAASSNPP